MVIVSLCLFMTFRHFGDVQLSQSVKHMQRYAGHDYSLKINRVRTEDAGHYTVRAENSFGKREFPVLLTVQPLQEIKIGKMLLLILFNFYVDFIPNIQIYIV